MILLFMAVVRYLFIEHFSSLHNLQFFLQNFTCSFFENFLQRSFCTSQIPGSIVDIQSRNLVLFFIQAREDRPLRSGTVRIHGCLWHLRPRRPRSCPLSSHIIINNNSSNSNSISSSSSNYNMSNNSNCNSSNKMRRYT